MGSGTRPDVLLPSGAAMKDSAVWAFAIFIWTIFVFYLGVKAGEDRGKD